MSTPQSSLASDVGVGVLSGVAATGVMTAFQKFVEMPLTGRGDSYAPAELAERILPIGRMRKRQRRRLNYLVHFALGTGWGAAHGAVAHSGLRGQRAVAAVFGTMYPGNLLLATALGVYRPSEWSFGDIAIDVVDKLVQAEATGAIFEAVRGRSGAA